MVASIEQVVDLKTIGYDDVVGRLKAYEERIKDEEIQTEQNQLLFTRSDEKAAEKGTNVSIVDVKALTGMTLDVAKVGVGGPGEVEVLVSKFHGIRVALGATSVVSLDITCRNVLVGKKRKRKVTKKKRKDETEKWCLIKP
ncbi:hypothetical protein E3N88_30881 [Mikania micrantha]|uniref:Uncharacterized protein n=1 Tax=Mikania micrantha TaxID=192012 RepID=A0A5N6MQ37_9ASTR|nr:hypothetical protein E3N88_30881 [Mikania micrantha]